MVENQANATDQCVRGPLGRFHLLPQQNIGATSEKGVSLNCASQTWYISPNQKFTSSRRRQ
eukprot:scaffold16470_cov61-Cyclotella_meneghiniana.AAC.1